MILFAQALRLSRPDLARQVSLFNEAVAIAQGLGDRQSELQARWGLSYGSGPEYGPRECLKAAQAFQDLARALGDTSAVFVSETLKGWALHDLGEFRRSMDAHRAVVDKYPPDLSAADANRFNLNHRAISMSDLSEASWQIGDLAGADAWNQAAIQEAGDHLPTLFVPASQHLCRALWEGSDWPEITRRFGALTERFAVDGRWKSWIRNLGAIIEIQKNASVAAFSKLDQNILAGRWQALNDRYIWIVVHFIQCCMTLGKMDHARKLSEKLVSVLRGMQNRWFLSEALRLRAIALVDVDPEAAAACFGEARAIAATLEATTFAKYIEASYRACRDRLPPGP